MSAWLVVAAAATRCVGQQATPPDSAPAVQEGSASVPTLLLGTQLVALDISVTDSRGHPVHGLPASAFRVEENARPQSIRNMEEHRTEDRGEPVPPPPRLPAGSYTNYTGAPPRGTLNVLLIDALNTSRHDQTSLFAQLKSYVKSGGATGQTLAIFGLNSHLFLLQGFTSDPALLRQAIQTRLSSRGSILLDDPNGTGVDAQKMSDNVAELNDPGLADLVANLQQFEADTDAQRLQIRAQDTLDGLNTLAHTLANYPGRKNLIWFSGSFPLSLLPDPALQNGFAAMQLNQEELKETTDLLTRAQVAVFPVDVRGVQTEPMYDAAGSGRKYAANPTNLGKDLRRFSTGQENEHSTMDAVASDTGGHAYYGTNDLAGAVRDAVTAGSSYYSVFYAPTSGGQRGELRTIHVALTGAYAAQGLQLSYRRGYFAGAGPVAGAADDAASAYLRNALSFGAPQPQDILFQASVQAASASPQVALAPGNQPAPGAASHGPFRLLRVDLAALSNDVSFTLLPNGNRTATVSFRALVYDAEGNLRSSVQKTLRYSLPPAAYRQLMNAGIGLQLQVSVPEHERSTLRLVIQDQGTGRLGALELPASALRVVP